ncbi:hypothetical protein R6Q57_023961 [Mikania cordata]
MGIVRLEGEQGNKHPSQRISSCQAEVRPSELSLAGSSPSPASPRFVPMSQVRRAEPGSSGDEELRLKFLHGRGMHRSFQLGDEEEIGWSNKRRSFTGGIGVASPKARTRDKSKTRVLQ